MRRYRRLVLMDRIIPFLAAFVGLIALGGAILVEFNARQRAEVMAQEMARLKLELERLSGRTEALAAAADGGTAEALLALQDRMNSLEQEWEGQPAMAAAPAPGTASAAKSEAGAATAAIDPNLPTEDCIPPGTRFMAMTGESYTICQTPAVVRVNGITADNVAVDGAGVIAETGFGNLPGTTCTLLVFSADIEGFAEMRVNCT